LQKHEWEQWGGLSCGINGMGTGGIGERGIIEIRRRENITCLDGKEYTGGEKRRKRPLKASDWSLNEWENAKDVRERGEALRRRGDQTLGRP